VSNILTLFLTQLLFKLPVSSMHAWAAKKQNTMSASSKSECKMLFIRQNREKSFWKLWACMVTTYCDQWRNWREAREQAAPLSKLNVKTGPLLADILVFINIYKKYSFEFH